MKRPRHKCQKKISTPVILLTLFAAILHRTTNWTTHHFTSSKTITANRRTLLFHWTEGKWIIQTQFITYIWWIKLRMYLLCTSWSLLWSQVCFECLSYVSCHQEGLMAPLCSYWRILDQNKQNATSKNVFWDCQKSPVFPQFVFSIFLGNEGDTMHSSLRLVPFMRQSIRFQQTSLNLTRSFSSRGHIAYYKYQGITKNIAFVMI